MKIYGFIYVDKDNEVNGTLMRYKERFDWKSMHPIFYKRNIIIRIVRYVFSIWDETTYQLKNFL